MKKNVTASLCISTYNRPDSLELCLGSVLQQIRMPDEIIIGDDGSGNETKAMIDKIKCQFSVPVMHVWHPDDGFKLAQIRNKSFAAAKGDYIIQVDGDVVLNKFFIRDHLQFARKNCFIAGTRSLLTAKGTQQILLKKKVADIAGTELNKKYNAIRFLPLTHLIYYIQKGISQAKFVLGANMAFWKEDLVKVNGYDENFEGWGKEDNDLSIRLCNAGIKLHFLKFAAIVYHLYHKEASNDKIGDNEKMLLHAVEQKITFAENGLNKYL